MSLSVPSSGFKAHILALMVTRRCNMTCAHCSVESGPHIKVEPSFEVLRDRITAAAESGVHLILLTGGEPMLREKEVLALVRHARRVGLNASVVTNGFWGATVERARRGVRRLRQAGIVSFTISPDRYHAPFQSMEHSLNIARAARAERVPLNVNLTRAGNDDDLDAAVSALEREPAINAHVHVRFYDVQPVGRGRQLPSLRAENQGACVACRIAAVTDDGRVTACNGPSYFSPAGSPLVLGSLADRPLSALLDQHARDPILETIRTFGVERLRDELLQTPGFERHTLRPVYRGMCDLCLDLTSNAAAVAALRERLSDERLAAERHAKWLLMSESLRDGPANYVALNSTHRARVFWPVASGQSWPDDADRTLGRADFDWIRAADYLSGCGLSGPLAPRLGDAALARWAPPFFVERLQRRALSDTLRTFITRDVLAIINESLDELGADGVVLKGAAPVARADGQSVVRAATDVDVWVPAEHAVPLRARLIERGFDGPTGDLRTAPHHLARVTFRGVPVEIHTRLLPAFWGLPEAEMLARRRRLPELSRLATLDREATLLHAVVHCTSHLFSHGLKAAWDVRESLDSGPIDWGLLGGWVSRLTAPRSFWTLFNPVYHELGLDVPRDFLERSPRDRKQMRLEAIARRRAFSATDVVEELNPFAKN
ncbi:MAG TPA: nucleotidyltransferase family protein, partial [Gaiellales bacterium]|nr:nucleotidyltransferase family protein [Gaiellales bacterium]